MHRDGWGTAGGGNHEARAKAAMPMPDLQHGHETRTVEGQKPRPGLRGGVGDAVGRGRRGRGAEHVGWDAVNLGWVGRAILVCLCGVEDVVREAGAWGSEGTRQRPQTSNIASPATPPHTRTVSRS